MYKIAILGCENSHANGFLKYIITETDSPYMAPVPNRGKRNKSDYISYIIEKIAQIIKK